MGGAHAEDLPLLYSFRRCPYAMRARIALIVCGHTVRVRELILRDKPDEMLAASPKGTVPVLITPGGAVVDESLEVMDWAIDEGDGSLQYPDERGRRLIAENDGSFKRDLDRYKYPSRYEGVDPDAHRESGASFLARLDREIALDGFVSGRFPGYADYAIFPFVRQFRIADPGWFDAQAWPALHAWLARCTGSEVFAKAMTKYPLWKETSEEGRLPG